ncbi:hypothetical protein FQA39_LY06718 [Lamprigera yunnana]|nr:hypothetical protein FQA39_LY06718 [Lamprigera yunnana]
MLNKFEENNTKLDETRTEIRTEMEQSMKKFQRQFLTIQERINEKWEKKYVDNNSGEINGICERLREQGTKLINVEAKINQHKEERIQVCEDLKEQKREIVNYIEKKIKIGNGTGHNVITKLQTYLEVIKKQIGNQYDQAMEDAIIREAMKGETETWYRIKQLEEKLDESTIVHILAGQFEENVHNKVMFDETKNFDDLVQILKAHDQCERDRKRFDGSKYYNGDYSILVGHTYLHPREFLYGTHHDPDGIKENQKTFVQNVSFIQIETDGKILMALIDTGAEFSLINENTIKKKLSGKKTEYLRYKKGTAGDSK